MECIIVSLTNQTHSVANGIFCLLAVAISFWENFDKIKSMLLYSSILLSIFFTILSDVLAIIGLQNYISGNPTFAEGFLNWSTLFRVISWALLTLHSATRAFMILLPHLRRPPLWVLSGVLVVIQLCIDLVGSVYFIKLQQPDFTRTCKHCSLLIITSTYPERR
ncbi:hypothetical protein BJ742DRAFT_545995 [Cladochytrium replicatum]|nr:hypothetical protein BJ742DRAFT_545995 [Cladochytrium replicatum]